jgi:hypothetical protein
MLVGSETGGGVEVKMWNIASIVNLVKWRTYNEVSHFQASPAEDGTDP